MQFLATLTTLGLAALALAAPAETPRDTTISLSSPVVVVTCQTQTFAWTGGAAPYDVTVTPAGGDAITVGSTDNTYISWVVAGLKPYTQITVAVADADGQTATTPAVEVVLGFSTTC